MNEVIIATKNKGKAKEFERIFNARGFDVKTLLDYPEAPDIEETGATFEENAILKAESASDRLGKMVIADDSGLEVDALGGRPGIYSARYAGTEKNDDANIDKVLDELKDVPAAERTARFRCVLAVSIPGGGTQTFSGSCEGRILPERRGTNGFGYDPVFYADEMNRSMAELEPAEKNKISHRARALEKLEQTLLTSLEKDGHQWAKS
ncbi:XTP/dITP diphosphatase [Mesobacillus zeae]|uniref:dITP/XTP pyrophosphatase n=1 Tax=Mesobacillus zeae TaxID=1917180 RepID=A0A398B638_9BACI|nr:XTP/dITP diphosphatase [Mesobacillus zeae]RID83226.1 XTP/dITP diphosphatase [Mesobacillus zeae]